MPTLATPAPTGRRSLRLAPWNTLTPFQRMTASSGFGRLGCDEGVLEDIPPVTDPAERQYISQTVAETLHMQLLPGEEIAQCHVCLAAVAGDDTVLDPGEGYAFCSDDHAAEFAAEQDAPPARLAA